jgi:hypothetical protein
MSVTFTRTVPQLVAKVLRKLGAIGIDETASAEDTVVVREAMDMRLKELHALGTLWFNVSPATTDVSLVAGTASKSLSAVTDFLFAVTANLRVGTEDKPIELVSHDQYQAITDKTERGEPSKVWINNGTAYFWPTPDANYTVKLTYQSIADDTTSTGVPDLPVSMMNAFTDLIAGDLVEEFSVPEAKASRLLAYAANAQKTIRILNSPRVDSTPVEIEAF